MSEAVLTPRAGRLVWVRDLFVSLVQRDLKLRYKRSLLAVAWSILNPVAYLLVLQLVFGRLMPLDIPRYTPFLFTGLLVWGWFSSSLLWAASAVLDHRDLIQQPRFPPAVLLPVRVTSDLIHFLIALPVLFIFLVAGGVRLTPAVLVFAGLTRQEVARAFDSIVDFAQIEPFIDNPYRTYSSGMKMRLGFAVAVHASLETMLMDELLSVGDHAFQRKCLERIAGSRRSGCTIALASHDTIMIRRLCDRVLWLSEGRLVELGAAEATVTDYLAAPHDETRHRTPATGPVVLTRSGAELRLHENRLGSLELEITDVRLLDRAGRDVTELDGGDPLRIEIAYVAHKPVKAPVFTASITSDDGIRCCETNSAAGEIVLPTLSGHGRMALDIARRDLKRGQYWVDVRVNSADWSYAYDHHVDVYSFTMRTGDEEEGVLNPPLAWDLRGVPQVPAHNSVHAGV